MIDPVKNFAKVYANQGYDLSAVSIVLAAGQGALLPQPSTDGAFNLVYWNYTDYADPADDPYKEIVRCTARTGDTITVTRAQEGTTASNKNIAGKTYALIIAITKKTIDDIRSSIGGPATTDDLPEGLTNKYYTDGRARSAISVTATGLSYSSSTGVISLATGYVIPTTTEESNWNTAYGWGNHASAGYALAANVLPYSGASGNLDLGTHNLYTTGKVRIGNTDTSRTALLEVNAPSFAAQFNLLDSDHSTWVTWSAYSNGVNMFPYMGTISNHPFYFVTNNSYRFGVGATGGFSVGSSYYTTDPGANNMILEGKLGIGTTNPSTALEVIGTGTFNQITNSQPAPIDGTNILNLYWNDSNLYRYTRFSYDSNFSDMVFKVGYYVYGNSLDFPQVQMFTGGHAYGDVVTGGSGFGWNSANGGLWYQTTKLLGLDGNAQYYFDPNNGYKLTGDGSALINVPSSWVGTATSDLDMGGVYDILNPATITADIGSATFFDGTGTYNGSAAFSYWGNNLYLNQSIYSNYDGDEALDIYNHALKAGGNTVAQWGSGTLQNGSGNAYLTNYLTSDFYPDSTGNSRNLGSVNYVWGSLTADSIQSYGYSGYSLNGFQMMDYMWNLYANAIYLRDSNGTNPTGTTVIYKDGSGNKVAAADIYNITLPSSSYWATSDPTTIADAIQRIAAVVSVGGSVPIP